MRGGSMRGWLNAGWLSAEWFSEGGIINQSNEMWLRLRQCNQYGSVRGRGSVQCGEKVWLGGMWLSAMWLSMRLLSVRWLNVSRGGSM